MSSVWIEMRLFRSCFLTIIVLTLLFLKFHLLIETALANIHTPAPWMVKLLCSESSVTPVCNYLSSINLDNRSSSASQWCASDTSISTPSRRVEQLQCRELFRDPSDLIRRARAILFTSTSKDLGIKMLQNMQNRSSIVICIVPAEMSRMTMRHSSCKKCHKT